MATATGRFTFDALPCGSGQQIVGASQVFPNSSSGPYFYEIWDGPTLSDGKPVGVVAYDYINARWSILFNVPVGITLHQNTTYTDDIGQLKAFVATLTSTGPIPLTDEAGNDVPYPVSFNPLNT